MTFDDVIGTLVLAVESVGTLIMVGGGAVAFFRALLEIRRPDQRTGAYQRLRRTLGRAILLGLEVLIVADIIRTILVEPSVESVLVLGAIVLIRIALSFSLEVEIDGAWPWSRWRTRGAHNSSPE